MLTKRLIACFDVVGGMVTKAVHFADNITVAPAEELAKAVYDGQIDELVFYDIMASAEKRKIDVETVRRVAGQVFVPFSVGGGIKDLADMYEALKAGAEKISVDSMAVRNPEIIREGAGAFGSQCVMLSTQVSRTGTTPSGYEVFIDGARTATGLDAIEWMRRGQDLGAGEICVNSIDRDGAMTGYDLVLMEMAGRAVSVPLIASGGAGAPEHLKELFLRTEAQAAIISSMLYSPRIKRNFTVYALKDYLAHNGIPIRPFIRQPAY